jgi:gliding motility-associated-like protein
LKQRFISCIVLLSISIGGFSQNVKQAFCGQKGITEQLFKTRPELKRNFERIERSLKQYNLRKGNSLQKTMRPMGLVTLPVVVHIIHNGGAENISDAQVLKGIEYLNEAFSNSGSYASVKGINTQIQFCMAERSPDGKPTNGITRDISPYTIMGGSEYYSDDLHVKDINRWNPNCYINIWLVKSIPGNVVGYANLPAAAGMDVDGIVMEAAYFGSSASNNVVINHEMGHYLGLYHTFEGGCVNNDCLSDGDKVCDTPPDQSTASVSCNVTMNSCTTDALSGFNADQNDLKEDFMDYGNYDCMNMFTAGQSDRMNWFIENVRYSLLNCKSCLPPCDSPVKAAFSASTDTIKINSTINFTNQSINSNNYKWYVDGILASSSTNFNYLFVTSGRHVIKMVASSSDNLCGDAEFSDTIMVTCPVKANFENPSGVVTSGQTVKFTNSSANASSYIWEINGVNKSTTTDLSFLFSSPGIYTITLIASDGTCKDSITNKLSVYDSTGSIPHDLCLQTSFQKLYKLNNISIYDLRPTKDSGYIMGGGYNIPGVNVYGGSYAAKISRNGSVRWSKYVLPVWSDLARLKETSDGNFIGVGKFYESVNSELRTKAALIKLNANGNLLWAKKFGISGSSGEKGIDVTETRDGGFAFCGSTNDDNWSKTNWMVCKTDAMGNIVWSKSFDNGFYERAYGIIANGDTLVVAGIRTIPTGPRSEIVITKLRISDGGIIQSKVFDVANRSVETTSLFKIPGGYMIGAHSIADGFYYADMDIVVLQLDENLNVIRSGRIAANIFASVHGGFFPTSDGGFVAAQDGPNWSVTKDATSVMLYKVSGQWQLEWAKQFPLTLAEGQDDFLVNGVFPTSDKGYILGSSYVTESIKNGNFRIIKTDDQGNTPGCNVVNFQPVFQIPNASTNDFKWAIESNIIFNDPSNTSVTVSSTNDAPVKEVQRCATSDCNYLKIQGRDSICNIKDTITYNATRNKECVSSVEWQTDTSLVNIISRTDSSIKVVFKKKGEVKIYARIITACLVLQDSMNVFIADNNNGIDLGPDIQLCKQSTIRLSAGSGFKSYKWNDGSVDSTLTAYNPGTYYVSATDFCGNIYDDTINITQAPDISLELEPDLKRCDNDSLTIILPANFEKYIWSPDYNINTTSANIVKVWPEKDTMYTVTAQKGVGCIAVDSVHIKVLQSVPISLGPDTSFCFGQQKILKAPLGFKKYTWQDGSDNQTFIAEKEGIYWLHALNDNGCVSKDTMQIIRVYPLPDLNLGKDGNICRSDDILNAGSGYLNYLWQDGSVQSTFEVNKPGIYWVTVTDSNYCSNSDTINISGFNPEPKDFLLHSLAICENSVEEITAIGNWQSYLWSNNSSQSSIQVSTPGTYWLQVTNNFGCKNKDTIHISIKSDCPQVIYFPNAFTPNNDGKNDYFKATAFAPIEKYHLIVYNRWGQKVFETYDITKGWDGRFKGVPANTDVFVWSCRYNFFGKPSKNEKGTVTLLR